MSASTTLITDANTMITAGPTATSAANAIAAAGPIEDYVSMLQLYKLKLQECKNLLNSLKSATDGSDGNLTQINNALLTLS